MAQLLTPEQVANRLNITVRSVYGIIRRNEIKYAKILDMYRISEEDLEQYVNKSKESNENEGKA